MDNMKISLLTLFLLFLGLPVQAGIYKWVDENGKMHYTQTPPPKEGRGASINADTFNSVKTVKAPPIPKRTVRPKAQASSNKRTEKKTEKKKVRRTRCNRR